MVDCKILIKEIVEELLSGDLTLGGIEGKINDSNISSIYKKGLIRMLHKEGVCSSILDTIKVLSNFYESEFKRVAIFEKVSEKQLYLLSG